MSAQKNYWLTLIVKAGATPKITHSEPIWLKAYFDETPTSCDAGEHMEGSGMRVSAEHGGLEQIKRDGTQRYDFQLTEVEYNAAKFKLYIWGEPYGRVAFRKKGAHEDLAVGRLELEPQHCQKGGLPKPPANSRPGDEQIICEIETVQSVVNFIVDEINTNAASHETQQMRALNDRSKSEPFYRAWAPEALASDRLGCKTHSNERGDVARLQDKFFCQPGETGGQWDHKPVIRPIWTTENRLGNSGFSYYYDIWSNIHFGFIAAKGGFSEGRVLLGAAFAQFLDQLTFKGDDPVDVQSIQAGYNLGHRAKAATIQDIINIVTRNPHWDAKARFAKST